MKPEVRERVGEGRGADTGRGGPSRLWIHRSHCEAFSTRNKEPNASCAYQFYRAGTGPVTVL